MSTYLLGAVIILNTFRKTDPVDKALLVNQPKYHSYTPFFFFFVFGIVRDCLTLFSPSTDHHLPSLTTCIIALPVWGFDADLHINSNPGTFFLGGGFTCRSSSSKLPNYSFSSAGPFHLVSPPAR